MLTFATSILQEIKPCPTEISSGAPYHQEIQAMSENSRQSESHIDLIGMQEEAALERRSKSERLADAVGVFAGSLPFIAVHLMFLFAWLLVNDGEIPWARPFDPYPFSLFGVIVAVEAVILSGFILMRQNRMMRRGERRDHLHLQVDLLAEKERRVERPSARYVLGESATRREPQNSRALIMLRHSALPGDGVRQKQHSGCRRVVHSGGLYPGTR